MTFLELCQAYRAEIGIPGTGPITVQNQTGELQRVVLDIQDADQDIKRKWQNWRFLWKEFSTTTVVGENYLTTTAPSDIGFYDPNSVWIDRETDDAAQLDYVEYEDWRNDQAVGVVESGDPYEFTVLPNKQIRVYPKPTEAHSFYAEYFKKPARLSNDGEISDVPEEYHRIIIVRAKMIYAEREDAPEIMAGSAAEYDDLITNLEAAYLKASQDGRQSSVHKPRAMRVE